MSEFQQSEQDLRSSMKPVPRADSIGPLLKKHWNLDVFTTKQIESYDDANFYCKTGVNGITPYLIKFYNAFDTENPNFLHGLPFMLSAINSAVKTGIEVPSIILPNQNATDNKITNFVFYDDCEVVDGSQRRVAVRVFKWIEGTTLSRVVPTITHMVQLGRAIADVTNALAGFDHPAFHRTHLWDLTQLDLSFPLLRFVDNQPVQECIRAVHQFFHKSVLPVAAQLPQSVIMADCNDANVLVTERAVADSQCEVTGLIDFSDAVMTWTVNEIAIAMAYALLTSYGKESSYEALGALFAGYCSMRPLSAVELQCLPVLILTRLSISVMVGAFAISKEPDNPYLKLHAIPGRDAISFLSGKEAVQHTRYFAAVQERAISIVRPGMAQKEVVQALADADVYRDAISSVYGV